MKKNCLRSRILFFILLSCCLTSYTHGKAKDPQADSSAVTADQDIKIPSVKKIRVLLDEQDIQKETKFIIKSHDGFILKSPSDSTSPAVYKAQEVHLMCKNKRLYLQCRDHNYRRVKYDSITIDTPTHTFTLGSTTYQGDLTVRIDQESGTVLAINKLPLEDYVHSVVRSECIPSWPLNMQKVQAVISRTYAVFLMKQARLKNPRYRYFDIKNTNFHQVYNGTHTYKHLRQAIDETQNLIVTHNGKVALTMFDICCGGIKPALMRYNDASKPYLSRKQACDYCQKSPLYQWKEDIHTNSFLESLKKNESAHHKLKNFKAPITDIKVSHSDKAGIVHNVKIFDKNKKPFLVTGNEVRTISLHKIKSLAFDIKKIRDRIVITGKGYGHLRGICQLGSKELLQRGWSVKSVLNFYYPGTTLSKLL